MILYKYRYDTEKEKEKERATRVTSPLGCERRRKKKKTRVSSHRAIAPWSGFIV